MFIAHQNRDDFNNCFQVSETILRCAKDFAFFFILLFSKNDQILNSKHMTCVIYIYQNIWPVKYTSLINSIIPEPNVRFFLSYDIRTMKTHSLQKKLWFCHYVRNDIMDVITLSENL